MNSVSLKYLSEQFILRIKNFLQKFSNVFFGAVQCLCNIINNTITIKAITNQRRRRKKMLSFTFASRQHHRNSIPNMIWIYSSLELFSLISMIFLRCVFLSIFFGWSDDKAVISYLVSRCWNHAKCSNVMGKSSIYSNLNAKIWYFVVPLLSVAIWSDAFTCWLVACSTSCFFFLFRGKRLKTLALFESAKKR